MKFFKIVVFIFAYTLGQAAHAFTVEQIVVSGNQRIKASTVQSYLPIAVGEDLTASKTANAIKALYESGLFNTIDLLEDGGKLIVKVKERPAIRAVKFDGNVMLKSDDIKKSMEKIELQRGRIFKSNSLAALTDELQRVYYSQGKYGVKIDANVKEHKDNTVSIDLVIAEGFPAKVVDLNIIGNRAFDADTLKAELKTGIPSWWAIFSSRDKYAKPKLQGDLEILRSWYMDRGYLNFSIESTQVAISEDLKRLYITINIAEGDKYLIDKVKLDGRKLVAEEDLNQIIGTLTAGEPFSRKKVQQIATLIKQRLGKDGFARATVNVLPVPNEQNHTVDIAYVIDKGHRVVVRNIEFTGHPDTQEHVLRREMRQLEGAWFDSVKIERSKTRLERLSFIQSAPYSIVDVKGSDDQVDIIFNITERLSGNLKAGIGYNGSEVFYNFGISKDNIFGTGNNLGLSFESSESVKSASINFTDPFYSKHGISRSLSAFYSQTDITDDNLSDYILNVLGAGISFGVPISEYTYLNAGINVVRSDFHDTQGSSQEVKNFLYNPPATGTGQSPNCHTLGTCKVGDGKRYMTYTPEVGAVYDSRNRTIFATRGQRHVLSVQATLPNSDLNFYKASLNNSLYVPSLWGSVLVLRNRLSGAHIYGDKHTDLPPFEKYYAGGVYTLRGFKANSLTNGAGTIDSNNSAYGANYRWLGSAEYVLPPTSEASNMRFSLFFDFGNVFAQVKDIGTKGVRSSAGVAFNWLTPVGSLVFSYAEPIDYHDQDRLERFQFNLGGSF